MVETDVMFMLNEHVKLAEPAEGKEIGAELIEVRVLVYGKIR